MRICVCATRLPAVSALQWDIATNKAVSEGWYLLKGNSCEVLLKEDLTARYYYIYAQDYDRGGEWAGRTPLCTRDKEFQIRGVEDCLARGYDRTRFFEIDTGEQKNWTIQLGEPERLPTAPKN